MSDRPAPKDECEKYLALQKSWVRAILENDYSSPDILPSLAKLNGFETLQKARDEYEDLLKRCPKHMREYRKRATERAKQEVLLQLGPVRPGRPPNRDALERGRRAAKMRDLGKTWGEVAQRWCSRKSEPGHVCNKLCADRIRLAATPYLRSE